MKQQTNHNSTGVLVLMLSLSGDVAEIITNNFKMNKLNLEELNVTKLDDIVLSQTNGGIWQYVVAYILIEALLNPSAHIEAFRAGYNS